MEVRCGILGILCGRLNVFLRVGVMWKVVTAYRHLPALKVR